MWPGTCTRLTHGSVPATSEGGDPWAVTPMGRVCGTAIGMA